MSSVATVNPGLANLLQSLSQISPLASSPQLVSALEKASPGDIAQLSSDAIQLQNVDALFGNTDASTTDPNSLFANLEQGLAAPDQPTGLFSNPSSNDSNTLLANLEQTLAGSSGASTALQGGLQASQIRTLFGNGSNLLSPL